MTEELIATMPPESPGSSEQRDCAGEFAMSKVPFVIPGEGYGVPRGTRYKARTFEGRTTLADLRFYNTRGEMYYSTVLQDGFDDVNPLDFLPPSTMQAGRNAIHYRLYGTWGGWGGWMDTGWFHVVAAAVFTTANNTIFTTDRPVLRGTGEPGARVQIKQTGGNENFSDVVPVGSNGQWEATLVAGIANSSASYSVDVVGTGDYWQVPSRTGPLQFIVLLAPQVITPTFNSIVGQNFPVSGKAYPGGLVDLVYSGGAVELKMNIPVDGSGNWTTTLALAAGEMNAELFFSARQRFSGETSNWLKQDHKLNVLGPPAIDTPTSNQEVEKQLTVQGRVNALFKGGLVEVRRDVAGTVLGSGLVNTSTGAWQAVLSQRLTPGPYSLTAVQVISGKTSVGTSPVSLKVRPPVPTITSSTSGETVTLSGTGYNGPGMRMDIHFSGNDTPYVSVTVSGGNWTHILAADLVPGNYRFRGRQSVSDGGSGRIYSSGWATEITVNVPTPKPTGITAMVNGQRTIFRGQANQWGAAWVEVYIFNNGTQLAGVPAAIVQSNRFWETIATVDLPPGSYTELTARQKVNNQWSLDSAKFSMTVETPIPEFNNPPENTFTDQRPAIEGKAWSGAQVTLKVSGMADVTVPATGGVFVRNAAEDWAPGTHTITATATFGGRTSLPATRTFTVRTPQPRIEMAENTEVGLTPVVTGTGYKNCWVVIHSAVTHLPIGAGPVGPDGKWSVTLADQAPQDLSFYAVQHESQQNSSNPSVPSAVRTVKVRVAKPLITVPVHHGRPTRTSLFSGTAQYPGTIELSIKGQTTPFLKDIEVQPDGAWSVRVTLPAGAVTLEAKLRQRNYTSEAFERVITVVPAVPFIDSPRAGEKLGRVLRMSGFGIKGDTIVIYRRGSVANTLARTTVQADGTWSASVVHNLIEHDGINVLASAGPGLDSALSPVVHYTLLSTAPSLTEPLSGDWVGVRPQYSGLATPGKRITVASWFDADDVLAPVTTADSDGRWSVVGNKDLPEGAMRVVVRQEDTEGVESARFMVERKAAGFGAPSVLYPRMGQSVGRYPMYLGFGEPGAEVVITQTGSSTTELGRARVGRDGRWALRSQIQLPVAATPYSYSVRQSRDGVYSDWLLPTRNLRVTQVAADFVPPVINEPGDDPNQVLEQMPVFSGRGEPGAEVHVYAKQSGAVFATARVNAEGRWSVRSQVDFPLLATAHQIWARQIMDDEVSQWSSTVSFKVDDQPALFMIDSPQRGAEVSSNVVLRGRGLPGGEVRLYRPQEPARIRWRAIVDSQGQWVIVTEALSVGRHVFAGYLFKNERASPSLPDFELNVIDGG